jgi:hypothetical protein
MKTIFSENDELKIIRKAYYRINPQLIALTI